MRMLGALCMLDVSCERVYYSGCVALGCGITCMLPTLAVYLCAGNWMSEGVSEAVGVSSGCLGLPLMF